MSDTPPVKGGRLARSAAMLCQDANFRLYLDRRRRIKFKLDVPDGTHEADDARDFILKACSIKSRAELDHDPDAAEIFRKIRQNYVRWDQKNHARS